MTPRYGGVTSHVIEVIALALEKLRSFAKLPFPSDRRIPSCRRVIDVELTNKVVVVTGGAHGIGRALCHRFAKERLRGLIVADLDVTAAEEVARESSGIAICGNVCDEAHIKQLVQTAEEQWGAVDLFCSNAGATIKGGTETPDADWQRMWELHVLSNVYAARAALPGMLARGSGYFLQTSSAAGLLTEIGSAAYTVSKHATIAFAEWLSINYRRKGIRVSCLCPSGVQTDMLDLEDPIHQFLQSHSLTPDQVAECVIQGVTEEKFLILPHPEVREFFAFKTHDYDRWLHNFSRMKEKWERQHRRDDSLGSI